VNNPGAGRLPSILHWHELYEAAVLEINLAKLPGRVEHAKDAIRSRMGELALSDQSGQWEALRDAINVLDDLLRMYKARQPKPPKPDH
jgi:hypothetical protein